MPTQLTLIRHGETIWNADHRWQGFAPVPLNDNGIAQAQDAALFLKGAGIQRIIASDLLRTRQTAEVIAEVLGLPIAFDSRLREINVGSWQGLTTDDMRAWDRVNYDKFRTSSQLDRVFPDGETYRQLMQRAMAAIQDVVQEYPDQHSLLVTHGGTIRAIVVSLNNTIPEHIENCTLTRLSFTPDTSAWDVSCVAQSPASVIW